MTSFWSTQTIDVWNFIYSSLHYAFVFQDNETIKSWSLLDSVWTNNVDAVKKTV